MPTNKEPRPTLAQVDRSGAVDEAAADAQEAIDSGHTRSRFLVRAGALAGGGVLIGSVPAALTAAQSGGMSKGDVKILNYALTLEYLESAFYKDALSKGALNGAARTFAQTAGKDEAAHVKALQQALGSEAVKEPSFDFKGTTGKQDTFLKTAMTLEDTGVSAYQGQAPKIASDKLLAAAASILAVEARHASWVRDIIGHGQDPEPAPDAFNKAKSMSAVLSAVKGTGFIKM